MIGHGYGPLTVEFGDGHKIEIWSPKTEVGGMMYGERYFNQIEMMHVNDYKNKLFGEIEFYPNRKGGVKNYISSLVKK